MPWSLPGAPTLILTFMDTSLTLWTLLVWLLSAKTRLCYQRMIAFLLESEALLSTDDWLPLVKTTLCYQPIIAFLP